MPHLSSILFLVIVGTFQSIYAEHAKPEARAGGRALRYGSTLSWSGPNGTATTVNSQGIGYRDQGGNTSHRAPDGGTSTRNVDGATSYVDRYGNASYVSATGQVSYSYVGLRNNWSATYTAPTYSASPYYTNTNCSPFSYKPYRSWYGNSYNNSLPNYGYYKANTNPYNLTSWGSYRLPKWWPTW
jgi:hypothetical protein